MRLERAYREEGRPSRMIALYREAVGRAPDDLAIAVRAPDLPAVHAFLGAVFERRGETREAFEEYRRALRLGRAFDWPQRCTACGATAPDWRERCAPCGRWNTLRPVAGR